MSSRDQTQLQGADEQRRSQDLSLQRWRPPVDVPGYEARRFLGAGAYGEVWVAIDLTTGRQVAIKFYAHRGGLDWSILSREVEKLAFLSADRYVVQLLDVGWDATPPYYVMEYIEQGSLDDQLRQRGRMPVAEAVTMFREVAIGLLHAHGKGVLHCDLKPANILLDQDQRPRLADFGQSRLTHEQQPALGTLFYMAPEQADLRAVPDARWDVYALGSLLYCMLCGAPPHWDQVVATEIEQTPDLEGRLQRYRQLLANLPPASQHRQIRQVDRQLADIIDRCLAVDPRSRYANVQAVLDALDDRARRHGRRPLLVLGAVGPAVLLLIIALISWRLFSSSIDQSSSALTHQALQSLGFASRSVATVASNELERRFETVENIAADPELLRRLASLSQNPELQQTLDRLSDPAASEAELEPLRARIRKPNEAKTTAADVRPAGETSVAVSDDDASDVAASDIASETPPTSPAANRFAEIAAIEERLAELTRNETRFQVASWFITDKQGLQLARIPASDSTAKNYAWRTYFHGGPNADKPTTWRPGPGERLQKTQLSVAYMSSSSQNWSVAISTPILSAGPEKEFLGVLALSFEIGQQFLDLERTDRQFAALVD
ncbi:MAG: protein kinase, partial [Planctomycetota bacterium]|nr:protein kinase [Planctomycetota bacterium]